MDESADDPLGPTEVFSLLANEKRFEIIATIAEAPYDEFGGTLSFSELWRRTEIDDSGQFNYHLEKLVGPFVRQTDEGYKLRHAGQMLYRIAVSELLTGRGEVGPIEVDGECNECGGGLVGRYEDEVFLVECRECGTLATGGEFPRSAASLYEPERLPVVFDRYLRSVLYRATDEVCHWCAGPLDAETQRDESFPAATGWTVFRHCDYCGASVKTGLGTAALFHPAVISFYHDHGVDALRRPTWDLDLVPEPPTVEVDDDPWRATLRLERDGETLTVEIDGAGRVRSVDRSGASRTE